MDAHGECESVPLGTEMLRDTLGEYSADSLASVNGHGEETGEEIKEGVWTIVIERSARVRSVLQHFVNPVKGLPELAATAVGVEKGEHIDADNRI